jgi:hypothetical protein
VTTGKSDEGWVVRCPIHYCNIIEALWLVNGGHGASLGAVPASAAEHHQGLRVHASQGSGRGRSAVHVPLQHQVRPARLSVLRVRGEIMGPGKYDHIGTSQSVLIMINPSIFTRTRIVAPRADLLRTTALMMRCARHLLATAPQ